MEPLGTSRSFIPDTHIPIRSVGIDAVDPCLHPIEVGGESAGPPTFTVIAKLDERSALELAGVDDLKRLEDAQDYLALRRADDKGRIPTCNQLDRPH